ncbi:MAG TPA: hypothetical protein VFA04_02640 [Bryobacteraceae bacterium]|nr:hypothetical protein [Bryobacteraceae bacterium]
MCNLRTVLLAAAVGLFSSYAAELPKGRIIDRVVCTGDDRQSYALYLPPAYSPDRPWPILYCLDPLARGRIPVERFAKAAGAAGWIVAGSNNSRNAAPRESRDAIVSIVRDTHERFAIDNDHVYVAGFSGGARLALAWARNGRIAGVVASGAAFGGPVPMDATFPVYGTAATDDFNFDEVYAMCVTLSRRGVPQHFAEWNGGHDWLPESLAGEAIDFLSGRLKPEPPPALTSIQSKTAERYQLLTAVMQRSDDDERRQLIESLHRDQDLPEDGPKRRAARRVLAGTFIGAIEQGRARLAEQKYADAAAAWSLALMIQPNNPEANYGLAVASAGLRDKRRAIEALGRAIANGFHDGARIDAEPAFNPFRADAGFTAVRQSIKPNC